MKPRLIALMAVYFLLAGKAMALTHIFYGGNGTTPVDSGLPLVGVSTESSKTAIWLGTGMRATGKVIALPASIGIPTQAIRSATAGELPSGLGVWRDAILAIKQNGMICSGTNMMARAKAIARAVLVGIPIPGM
jgi:hypothetical protein